MEDKLINRFLKGVFRLRPVFPKYKATWDPRVVLEHISKFHPLKTLSLQKLTYKLSTLMALSTGHRLQTLSKINIQHIITSNDKIEILIYEMLKSSSPSKDQPRLVLPYFHEKPELCVASTLLFYIEKTREIRGNTSNLFITHKRPYKTASAQTISRWIKSTLKESGVDTEVFTAYSTRHASTSMAFKAGTSIETIRAAAGWSKESEVFFKYYNRDIKNPCEFASRVIDVENRNK